MKLDVRLPIGAMFTVDGLLLTAHGFLGGGADAVGKAGMNVTLIWGIVLVVFGGTMLGFTFRTRRP
jgi:hypothetical protein